MRGLPRRMPPFLAVAALAVSLTFADGARAQSADCGPVACTDPAFENLQLGIRALEEKRFEEACPRLQKALALVPDAIGTNMAMASCWEGLGKLGRAHCAYARPAMLAATRGQTDRAEAAQQAMSRLEPQLTSIRVRPEKPAEVNVEIDHEPFGDLALTGPLLFESGPHVLVAKGAGFVTLTVPFEVRAGETLALGVALEPLPRKPETEPTTPKPSGGLSLMVGAGLLAGGVGVASTALGGALYAMYEAGKADIQADPELCGSGKCTNAGSEAMEGLDGDLVGAGVLFMGGGIMIVSAAFLVGFGVSQDKQKQTVRWAPGPGLGIAAEVTF